MVASSFASECFPVFFACSGVSPGGRLEGRALSGFFPAAVSGLGLDRGFRLDFDLVLDFFTIAGPPEGFDSI